LIFQLLDTKHECYKIFCADQLHDDYSDEVLTHTWAPSPSLLGKEVEYAQIWSGGKTLADLCPEKSKHRFKNLNDKAKVFLKTFFNARINLDDVCFYDCVPEKFLLDYFSLKNEIAADVFENYKKPLNHDFMRDLVFFVDRISNQTLNIDSAELDMSDEKTGAQKISLDKNKVIYNPWGTVTGRLTTQKNSFPILTLNKNLRKCLKPQNDVFLELDYNASELRVLLGLLEQAQPEEDLHSWLAKEVFDDKYTREQVKKKVFAWLYNPTSKNKRLNTFFDRQAVLEKYYDGHKVDTPYYRTVKVDEEKALNYLIQSSSSDMMLTAAMKLDKMLKNKKSFVAFCIHDSIVLDISAEDKELVENLRQEFSKTRFGNFRTNMSLGMDFGDMKRIA
jgi:hypothetical protein